MHYKKENKTMKNVMTHGGVFHADEIFATLILEKVFGELNITRTFKVPNDIPEDTIVYDIGGGKFDHHQAVRATRENGIPYAACGLIWREYGYDICQSDDIVDMVERDLIMGIDAIDNGIQVIPADTVVHVATVSNIIHSFNPTWDSEETSDEAFYRALDFARPILDNYIKNAKSKCAAKTIVETELYLSEYGIMVLNQFVPWKEHLFNSENRKADDIMFVIFPSVRGGWNVQCVPDKLDSFGQRKSVPDEWKGATKEELVRMTGCETVTFCHPSGFLMAADTKEDAMKLAMIAMVR